MTAARRGIPPSGDMPRPAAPPGWETCAACGCWELAACWSEESGACFWVEEDLCSHCAERLDADPVLAGRDDDMTCNGRPNETPGPASTRPGRQLCAARQPEPQPKGSRAERSQPLADRPGSLSVGARGPGRRLHGDPVRSVAGGTAASLAGDARSDDKMPKYQILNITNLMRLFGANFAGGRFLPRFATQPGGRPGR